MKSEAKDDDEFAYRAAGINHNAQFYNGLHPYGGPPRQILSIDGSNMINRYSGLVSSHEGSFVASYATESDAMSTNNETPSLVKLKGVTWPGMNIFDAASEDMKRKRNQRKDNSVTERLLASSESIHTDELVFNAQFELQRCRDVYDSPSPPPEDVEVRSR